MSIEQILQWFSGISQMAFGFLLGSIITGWFTIKFVVPRIMKNKDIQELKALFSDGKMLFKEAIPILKEILENQKKKDAG